MAEVEPYMAATSDREEVMDVGGLNEEEPKVNPHSHEHLTRAQNAFRSASESRKKYDWEWLARDLFRRGYQFSRYNPTSKTVVLATKVNTRIPINLTAAAMRVIRNQVTAFRPKWEVVPRPGSGEDGKQVAKFSGKILDTVWKEQRLKKKTKETVMQGLTFSIGGPWQIEWDEKKKNLDKTIGNISISINDPFDFYFDSNCTDGLAMKDAEFIGKAVRKSLNEIRNDPKYQNTDQLVSGDPRVAASESKQFLLQSLKFLGQYKDKEDETVILKEFQLKEHVSEENFDELAQELVDNRYDDKAANLAVGDVLIRIVAWTDDMSDPLRDELTDLDDFNYRLFQADINPMEVLGEGWARHVIPINRVINALESSVFEYNYKFAKGRLVVDKNSGVKAITNEHGSIIEKNKGATVSSLPIQSLPSTMENQIIRMRQYFEDISGAHDVSLGRIPSGVKSGIGIAELKQADATNQDDIVDNLEDFLVEVGQKVLEVMAKNLDTPRIFDVVGANGQIEHFAVIGERFAQGREKQQVKIGSEVYPLIVLPEDNKVDVQIGSWLAYSKSQRQEELKNLYEMGVIDQKTLLEHLEFGDVDAIVDRTRAEAILNGSRGQAGNTNANVSEEQLALSENEMIMEGKQVDAQPQDDHEVHIAVHNEGYGKGRDTDFQDHIAQHEAYLGGQKFSGQQPAGGGGMPTQGMTQQGAPQGMGGVPPAMMQ